MLFLAERFLRQQSSKLPQHPEWTREVNAVSANFTEITGIKFSPSKMELLKKRDRRPNDASDSESIFPNGCGHLWIDEHIEGAMRALSEIATRDSLKVKLFETLERSSDEYEKFF